MDTIARIEKYIANTKYQRKMKPRYVTRSDEICDIARKKTPCDAVILAFEYGQAKGYRAAKAEMKQKT